MRQCLTSCGRGVPEILEDECTDTIDWPARSHDLNPIEHLWNIRDQCIPRLPNPPRTVQELTNALVKVWQDNDRGTIHRLIRSMPLCCRACIQARGGHSHHYCCVLSIWMNEWSQFWDKSISRLSLCFSKFFREFLVKWLFPICRGQFCSVLPQIG